MYGEPSLYILGTPQQALGAGEPADGREGLGIAGGIAPDAGNGFMKTFCELINRQKDGRARSDRCLSHFDNPIARLGSSSSCAEGLLGG